MDLLEYSTEAVRKLCRDAGMTQKDLAMKLGINQVTLSHKLNGKLKFTDAEIYIIAQTFNKKFVIG
jgi:transcriptional regulator with XRE-family HTH domain